MQCCWQREKVTKKNYHWTFKHGTCVSAPTFDEAVMYMNKISKKNFWASETCEGQWDVQLSDNVVHYDIKASTVLSAVDKARWNTHLDLCFQTLEEGVISEKKRNECVQHSNNVI